MLVELARRGHAIVDTDYDGFYDEETLPDGRVEQRWREDRIEALLETHHVGALFVSRTVPNQGRFYPRFYQQRDQRQPSSGATYFRTLSMTCALYSTPSWFGTVSKSVSAAAIASSPASCSTSTSGSAA